MLFKELLAIYCMNNIKYTNTLCSYDVLLQHSLQTICLLVCFKWFTFVEKFDLSNVRVCCIYSMYSLIYVCIHVLLLNVHVKESISTP